MKLRTRKIQTEKVAPREEANDSRKRHRSNKRENTVDVKHRERQRMRCLIERDLWDNSSSTDYEPEYDEDEGSDGEISLEAESNVDGKKSDRVCNGEDSVPITPKGSSRGVASKKWSSRQEGRRRGGMGSSPADVEERRPGNGVGNGKSEVRMRKGNGNCWIVGEDCDVVL